MVEKKEAEDARKVILELVTRRIPRRFGLDPVRDVQVLTPMNRGPAGTILLNEELQAALNPGQPFDDARSNVSRGRQGDAAPQRLRPKRVERRRRHRLPFREDESLVVRYDDGPKSERSWSYTTARRWTSLLSRTRRPSTNPGK